MLSRRLFPVFAAASLLLSRDSFAQVSIPQPALTTLSPPAARAGSTVELSITGTDLDNATSLIFSASGITCAPKLNEKGEPVANRFVATIPADAPAMICDARVAARYGVSNPRGFMITALPVVQVPAAAANFASPFKASLNTVLTGSAARQSSLFVALDAKAGQHVIAVCRPRVLDSRMDAALSLRSHDGRKLASLAPDGLLDFTAPADGEFILELSDLQYHGDAEHPFALTLTTGPVIERVFEGEAEWTLYGRNLPQGRSATLRYGSKLERARLPAEEAKRLLAVNPVEAVRFGPENDAPGDTPPPLALKTPARYTGWFAPRGRARSFTFEAKKGEVLWMEVQSARRGLAVDPFFVVEKADAFIAEANDTPAFASKGEFDGGSADPTYRFEAKEDGTYRVKLRNLVASGPQEPFSLSIQPAGKDFDLVAIPVALPKAKATNVDMTAAPLWRGGVAVLKVFALRRSGFDAAIELAADGLPADTRFLGGLIPAGRSVGYAAFFAEETARAWAGPVTLHGKTGPPARGAALQFKVANTAKESVLTRLSDGVALGVVPSTAPVSIEAASPIYDAPAAGTLTIPLRVKRQADCTEALKLASLGIEGLATEVPAKADKAELVLDIAKLKLAPGDHPVILQGLVKFKHRRNDDPKAAPKDLTFLVHSKPIIVRVNPAEKKS
jgi:hypothetical protein